MDMPTRPLRQPGFHLGVLVRAVVVHDQMDIQLYRHVRFDAAQEGEELLMAVARFAIGEHRTVVHVESGKQELERYVDSRN